MANFDLNQSVKFILPMISELGRRKEFYLNDKFIGCYVEDINKEKTRDKIILVYKFDVYNHTVGDIKHYKELYNHKTYLKGQDYDYNDKNIVVYMFNVPKEFQEDYQLILEGKYSEISPTLKLNILKFWDSDKTTLLHSILFKGQKIKEFWKERGNREEHCIEGEYWYIPKPDMEVFDVDNDV